MQVKRFVKKDLDGNVIKIKEFNVDGDIVYVKNKRGNEKWYSYDANSNMICVKYSKLFNGKVRENIFEYDANNNMTMHKDTILGVDIIKSYNEHGMLVSLTDANNLSDSFIHSYDDKHNIIHTVYMDGIQKWYEYDDRCNIIHSRDSQGYNVYRKYYDDDHLLSFSNSNGTIKEFNKSGRMVYYKTGGGIEKIYKYDESNRLVYSNELGKETFIQYDPVSGKIVYRKTDSIEFKRNDFGHIILKNDCGEGFSKEIEYFKETASGDISELKI